MQASELFAPPMAALLHTIRQGDEAQARRLLADGLDLNVHGKDGIPPLLWLIYETHDKAAVQLALKLGADANFKDGAGDSAVNWVAGGKDPDWLRIILDAGGDPNSIDRNGQPALFSAIGEERWADIELLTQRGADLNKQDKLQRNSALYAAYINQYQIAHWLIEKGASVNGYDSVGADLAWVVYDAQSIMSPDSPRYVWLRKVKQQLEQQGRTFPPLSPRDVQARRAQGEKL